MWNLLQIQSRHHNFVLPIQKSQFLPASPQAAVKKRWKTFKTESLWFFSEFRSHFRLHIQWNPFPTPQRQDHQKEGRTSCLWKKDSLISQNILDCCFLKPEQPNVETTSGTDQLPLIRHIKLVAGQRGQDVAATECFLYFFLDILAFTYTV